MAAVGTSERTSVAADLLDPIPANRLLGVKVLEAHDGRAEVGLDVAPQATNVIGSLHSSGLAALVDAAGLAAIISLAGTREELDRVVPLGSMAELEFLAPARGRLTATCRIGGSDRLALRRLLDKRADRAMADTAAEIRDGEGTLVCRGSFTWKLRRLTPA